MRPEISYVQVAEDVKKDVTTSIWEEDSPAQEMQVSQSET